jgi:hypothetical protein
MSSTKLEPPERVARGGRAGERAGERSNERASERSGEPWPGRSGEPWPERSRERWSAHANDPAQVGARLGGRRVITGMLTGPDAAIALAPARPARR